MRIIRLLDTTFYPCNFSFFFFVGAKLLLYHLWIWMHHFSGSGLIIHPPGAAVPEGRSIVWKILFLLLR